VCSLWALTDASHHTLHLPWLRTARGELDVTDTLLLHSLVGPTQSRRDFRGNPSRALPDFLTPRPTTFVSRFEDELTTVRSTPPKIVCRDLVATHAPNTVPEVLRAATRSDSRATRKLLGAICDALQRYWERALAPNWSQMRLVLEADTTYRARQLATGGARLLFADIHPNVRWSNGVLSIEEMIGQHTMAAAGRGLLLIPSIFAYKPVTPLDPGEPPWLTYPTRGIATLWSPLPQPDATALEHLARTPTRTPARPRAANARRAATHNRDRPPAQSHPQRGLPTPPGAPRHRTAHAGTRPPARPLPPQPDRRPAHWQPRVAEGREVIETGPR
jgi:hypothetical protein